MTDTKDMPEPVAWTWNQLMYDSMGGWEQKCELRKPGSWVKPEDIEDLTPLYSSATVTALMERVEKAERELLALKTGIKRLSDEEEYCDENGVDVSNMAVRIAFRAKSAEAERDAAIARAERAERLLAEARKALEPFAKMADQWHSTEPNKRLMDYHDENASITLGHCRAARSAARAIVNKEGGE